MITELFLQNLRLGLSASLIVLLALLIRPVKGLPKQFRMILWGIVALRLTCPVSLGFPAVHSIPPLQHVFEQVDSSIRDGQRKYDISSAFTQNEDGQLPDVVDSHAHRDALNIPKLLSCIWTAGTGLFLIFFLYNYFRLSLRLKHSVHIDENIFLCNELDSPISFGLIRSRIYLPSCYDSSVEMMILRHERIHIARWDPQKKIAAYILLCFNWYNPFIWIAFLLFSRDLEYLCDESVAKGLTVSEKAMYCRTLLDLSAVKDRSAFSAFPIGFAESNTRKRIVNILNSKRTRVGAGIGILLIFAAVCLFLSYPYRETLPEDTVIHAQLNAQAGKELWSTFTKDCQAGKPAEVDLAFYEYPDEYTKAVLEDPAFWKEHLHDAALSRFHLSYDGSRYCLSWAEGGAEQVRYYQNLVYDEGDAATDGTSYQHYRCYMLTNTEGLSRDDLLWRFASSRLGDAVDYFVAYSELIP